MIVDAKNEILTAWYQTLGFERFVDRARTLFVTNATMAAYLRLSAAGL